MGIKGDEDKPVRNLLVDGPAEPFRAIVAGAADGVIGIDSRQRIVLFNRAAEDMFGYSVKQAIGQPLTMLLAHGERAAHVGNVNGFIAGGDQARYMGQRHESLKALRADGSEISVAISILQLATDDGPLMVALVRDISERVELLEQQVQLATRDSLTGAFNRRAFLERAEFFHRQWCDASTDYALMLLDLDHFKSVNDSHGHAIGDAVLHDFARLCAATLRDGDVFARWGGEEFVALLPRANVAAATAVAERIRLRTSRRTTQMPEGAQLRQTVSIGIAVPPNTRPSFDEVIKLADHALYAAKSAGRNRVSAVGSVQVTPKTHSA